jgi:ubiquinone/menaquinone biosynthesis C-methylase UbiE
VQRDVVDRAHEVENPLGIASRQETSAPERAILSREVSARRGEIVKAVEVGAGQAVADIGAGTGLFTREFAKAVGAEGRVYAVDISPAFLKHIAEEAKKAGQEKVIETVLGAQDGTNLAAGTVDVVFICDTYHHFDDPKAMLASIRQALRPGGRLYVIDFDRDGDASEFVKNHVRAAKEVFFGEIEGAGFEKFEPPAAPELKENFFAAFRRVEKEKVGAAPGDRR